MVKKMQKGSYSTAKKILSCQLSYVNIFLAFHKQMFYNILHYTAFGYSVLIGEEYPAVPAFALPFEADTWKYRAERYLPKISPRKKLLSDKP